ncbi:PREDICTED: LOW QUALITY PROTEIN: sialate O-acetylesterase [Aptenodytes forsteri]|uniref:LOW QUALITY PROTEIN: sialate O-acetylesterase n=1 Tax=Aptenodytes forsteri TaxID=9233 RepID=UPI00090586DB|nr:PREDICTED: LOW QUALITY PROTEIN: sialate O-acetylesterase [Aptenodytes forsteri]
MRLISERPRTSFLSFVKPGPGRAAEETGLRAMLGFASYYGDHMVLQKEPAGAVVWGYGEPGAALESPEASCERAVIRRYREICRILLQPGQKIHAKLQQNIFTPRFGTSKISWRHLGPSGTWTTVLDPMDRGGPYALTAGQGSENLRLRDIYFGDVWLCSGQSNMAMTVLQITNASQELAAAARYPYVRVFAAAPARSDVELEDLERIDLPWSIPTAENLGHGNFTYFSAVCWLLGRYLYEALRYPVGLVEAAWGGTPIEAWSSRRALWACGLPERGELSTYHRQSPDDSFARLRWHQTADLGVVPNARMPGTFMAVAMDLCDERSPYGRIHPRDKQNVAHRLHLGARAVAYGEKGLVFQGPYPTRAVLEVSRGLGLLNLTYSQELVCRRRDTRAFEVCCSSQPSPCGWLPALVVAVESRTVTLALAGCGTLVLGLRYAWAEWPCEYESCALYNTQGLPAPPFLVDALPAGETPGRSETAGGRELLLLPGSWFSRGI